MEVDSSGEQEWEAIEASQAAAGSAADGLESGVGSIMKDLMTSVPGMDYTLYDALFIISSLSLCTLYSLFIPYTLLPSLYRY